MNFGPNKDHLILMSVYWSKNRSHHDESWMTGSNRGQFRTIDFTLLSIHYLDRIYSEREPLMLCLVTFLIHFKLIQIKLIHLKIIYMKFIQILNERDWSIGTRSILNWYISNWSLWNWSIFSRSLLNLSGTYTYQIGPFQADWPWVIQKNWSTYHARSESVQYKCCASDG